MNKLNKRKLDVGLYLVATPIGSARDITLRALDILQMADILVAEDTRNLRKLMNLHGIALRKRCVIAYHDYNGAMQRPKLMEALSKNLSLAYVTDAGTPLIADPGYALVKSARANGFMVFTAPGASAILAALCVSALPPDRFLFAGFVPTKTVARIRFLQEFATVQATLIFYESAKRLIPCLSTMREIYSGQREMALCRELTKKFEQVLTGTINQIIQQLMEKAAIKGECVLVLGLPVCEPISDAVLKANIKQLLTRMSFKDTVNEVAYKHKVARKKIYSLALKLKNKS